MRADLRSLKSVTVSAGEIAERDSFVDLRDVRNPRTDRKRGCCSETCVEIQSKVWWEAAYGACPGTAEVAAISVRQVARYSSPQQGRKSLDTFLERKKENPIDVCLENWGFCTQKTNSPDGDPLTGI